MGCKWWKSETPSSILLRKTGVWKEFMSNMKELWDAYQAGTLGGTSSSGCNEEGLPCESTFCENFEQSWITDNTYTSSYTENFESAWFENNNFINQYIENFDTSWFTINNYTNLGDEDFESSDWDE